MNNETSNKYQELFDSIMAMDEPISALAHLPQIAQDLIIEVRKLEQQLQKQQDPKKDNTRQKKAIDLSLRDTLVASDGSLANIISLELQEMEGKSLISVSTIQDEYDGHLDGNYLLSPERIVFVVDSNSQ